MPALKDVNAKVTRALPNGAANVTSTSINTGRTTSQGNQPGGVEYLLTGPALTTGELPDTQTMKYDILISANSDLSSPTTYIASALTQTGAGGAGAAAATFQFRLPSNAVGQYVGFKATNSGAGNASGKNATLEALA